MSNQLAFVTIIGGWELLLTSSVILILVCGPRLPGFVRFTAANPNDLRQTLLCCLAGILAIVALSLILQSLFKW